MTAAVAIVATFAVAEREQTTASDYLRGLVTREAAKHVGWTPDAPVKRGAKR